MTFVTRSVRCDIVVCGAGLAGISAAVSAARLGATVCLINDRPVLGGNSSSEVRVQPQGAARTHGYARETGVISELLIEDRRRNHAEVFEAGWANSVWDLGMYDLVQRTPGLTLYLNTTVTGVDTIDRRLTSVTAMTLGTETVTTFEARTFIDCTGDGVVAALAGCEWRMGTEGFDEFAEPHAPATASEDVMGSSILLKTRDMGRPVPFEAPPWAITYDDASFFTTGGRYPGDTRGGWWWLEIGVPWHTITDSEAIRHELTRHALGVWDWVKNRAPELRSGFENLALEWLGQVVGKRESRRIMGQYLMTEHDLLRTQPWPDEVAYGGWTIDLHTPGGLLAATSEPSAAAGYSLDSAAVAATHVAPFGIPLRSLIAKDLDNLLMAGRDISVTHVALGSVRVQATTAVTGQAAGTAAAVALDERIEPCDVVGKAVFRVQQQLLRDGVFLPGSRNRDPADVALRASVSASSTALSSGLGPDDEGVDGAMLTEARAHGDPADLLDRPRGQWIPVEAGPGAAGISSLAVCVSNLSDRPRPVTARLRTVAHIWDYGHDTGDVIAEGTLSVPPGREQWSTWQLDQSADAWPTVERSAVRYLRLDLDAAEHVAWHRAGSVQAGALAGFTPAGGRMRRYGEGMTMSYRVAPAQRAYPASEVLTGVARPHASTNQWRSDPTESFDQWLQLTWPQAQEIGHVGLTFDGHLLGEYHRYPPGFVDPHCVRDYTVQVWQQDAWHPVVEVAGNYQTRRRHRLAEVARTDRLRVLVHATNGDPSAAIYEVRCYARLEPPVREVVR